MEIASISRGNRFFDTPFGMEESPLVEYVEDGTVKAKFFSLPVLDRNLCINPITTIQDIYNKIILKRNQNMAFDVLQSLKQSYFSDFENAIVNDEAVASLSIDTAGYTEKFEKISNFFCFNKTEWAKIFSVSRVTVYDWLNGKTKPTGVNAKKINSIYNFLRTIPDNESPISQTYLYQNISKYNKSLKEIFLSSQDIVDEYQDLDKTVVAMIKHSGRNKERLVRLAKSKRSKEEILDYNLKNLSY